MGRKNKKKRTQKKHSKREKKISERVQAELARAEAELAVGTEVENPPEQEKSPEEMAKSQGFEKGSESARLVRVLSPAERNLAKGAKETLLEIRDLKTWFYTDEGIVKAVNGVNLKIGKGETLGIVGESACGKSVTAFSIMQLIPDPPGKIVGGQILFEGKDIVQLDNDGMREIRGNDIAMIFQEPMTSLNPVFTVGDQIAEVVMLHQKLSRANAWKVAEEMLEKVGIPEPADRVKNYPHEMSGGMKQRVSQNKV